MEPTTDPIATDQQFFAALLAASASDLDGILAADFVLIDVMEGSEIPRHAFLEVLAGPLRFLSIEPAEVKVRRYAGTAIVTGRTLMHGQFGETPFSTRSRYTHVYIAQEGRWRLAAAQGTPISQGATSQSAT